MMMNNQFDDIRPYRDSEIPAAMQRIADCEAFPLLASYVFPDKELGEVRSMVLGCKNISEFQSRIMYHVNKQIIARSISRFSYSGVEQVDKDTAYLYVANHRDIMLDASLLQNILLDNGCDTTHITFGANLMTHPTVVDVGKSNKMFRVERGGSMRDFYMSSRHLSDYIRHVITDQHQSVWIAQRNGRTKDGNDATDQGIIKMFGLSCPDDKIKGLAELHILPIAVSYEWEPCDVLKAIELYSSRSQRYIKKPGEDLNSILTGITSRKGDVHFEFCKPIGEDELMQFNDMTANDYHRAVARLIDQRLHEAYRLTPNNYIAHDLRYEQRRYADRYTTAQRQAFIDNMAQLRRFDADEPDVLRDIFLGIYANPVENNIKP